MNICIKGTTPTFLYVSVGANEEGSSIWYLYQSHGCYYHPFENQCASVQYGDRLGIVSFELVTDMNQIHVTVHYDRKKSLILQKNCRLLCFNMDATGT